MLYCLLKSIGIFLFKIFFGLKVEGKENIPKKGGVLIASNHISYLDPIVAGLACPRRLFFLAKKELFDNPLFSHLIKSVGAIPIKRGYADLRALREAMRKIDEGKALLVFPQGRRTKRLDDGIKRGIILIAKKTGAPVVCAHIQGTDKALPRGAKRIMFEKIKVVFFPPVRFGQGDTEESISQTILRNIYFLS